MAGTAVHLAVADVLCRKLGKDFFKNIPLFYSGNIAPDAIHARENYVRAFKKHTHLTEGISGGDFQDPEKVRIFHDRLNCYIHTYYDPSADDSDLYLGYIIHLVTDELFNIHVRQQFVSAMEKDGIAQEDPAFFRRIIQDIESTDSVVLRKYPYTHDVRSMLGSVWDYAVKDMVTADEINRSKRWIMDRFSVKTCAAADPQYYSYEKAVQFIGFSAESIHKRFTEDNRFPEILC